MLAAAQRSHQPLLIAFAADALVGSDLDESIERIMKRHAALKLSDYRAQCAEGVQPV